VSNSVKEVKERGAAELERLLKRIPRIKLKSLKIGTMRTGPGFDVQVRMELDGKQHTLIAGVKISGQPRYAREAILRLKAIAARSNPPAMPVFNCLSSPGVLHCTVLRNDFRSQPRCEGPATRMGVAVLRFGHLWPISKKRRSKSRRCSPSRSSSSA
jgi:hypothetical protein